MQMIRQQHAGEHVERPLTPNLDHGPAEEPSSARVSKERTPLIGHDGEEVRRAALPPTHVIRHVGKVSIVDRVAKSVGESAAGRARPTKLHRIA